MEIHSCPLAGLLIFHSLNVCSQSSEFTNQILVAPFNVVDILHKSLPLGSQARNHQGRTPEEVTRQISVIEKFVSEHKVQE